MNPITHQVHRTVTSPRRFGFVSLAVLVGVLLLASVTIPVIKDAASAVQYGSSDWITLEASDDMLCPGETMTYTVTIDIARAPAKVDIDEAWCVANRQCPHAFKLPPDFSIAGEEGSVGTFVAERVVPDLPPGKWEFRHINATKTNGAPETLSGYNVFITVPDDCAQ